MTLVAEVDIEAQDDGVMGKIILDEKESSINVGTVIAMLAEEGDDISNIQAPQASSSSSSESSSSSSSSSSSGTTEDLSDHKVVEAHKSSAHASSSPSTAGAPGMPSEGQSHPHGEPKHNMPLMPSVLRALKDANISDASEIKATGFKGRLTKGDVLAYLGKIDNPHGTAAKLEEMKKKGEDAPHQAGYGATGAPQGKETLHKQQPGGAAKEEKVMSGAEFRRLVSSGLSKVEKQESAAQAIHLPPSIPLVTFEDVLEGYLPRTPSAPKTAAPLPSASKKSAWDEAIGL